MPSLKAYNQLHVQQRIPAKTVKRRNCFCAQRRVLTDNIKLVHPHSSTEKPSWTNGHIHSCSGVLWYKSEQNTFQCSADKPAATTKGLLNRSCSLERSTTTIDGRRLGCLDRKAEEMRIPGRGRTQVPLRIREASLCWRQYSEMVTFISCTLVFAMLGKGGTDRLSSSASDRTCTSRRLRRSLWRSRMCSRSIAL